MTPGTECHDHLASGFTGGSGLPAIPPVSRTNSIRVSKRRSRLIAQRDPKDEPILALTLKPGYPLWTEDRDFDAIPGISVRRTA